MRFNRAYSKLNNKTFTTIREDKGYYWPGKVAKIIIQDKHSFYANVLSVKKISIHDIDDELAYADADMSADHLKTMLQRMYSKRENFKGYVLITLEKRAGLRR